MIGLLRKAGFYVLLALIWEAVSRAGVWPPYLFPSPLTVFETLLAGFKDKSFLIGLLISLQRIFVGYTISVILGLSLGVILGLLSSRKWLMPLNETIRSLITALQVLPSICWLPLAILWFGLNEGAIQFIVIMGALFSIVIAVDGGIRNVSKVYVGAAHTMGIRGVDLYVRVMIPAALPSIVTGMKLGWSFAWRALMAGELIFVSVGLGKLLQIGRELNDMSQVMAVMLIIMAIGLVFDKFVFAALERRIRRMWGTA